MNKINTFKDVAYEILKEAGKPLHSDEITKIAMQKGSLITDGKTPEATMNAQLVVDINKKGTGSRFKKVGPSIFSINDEVEVVKNEKLTEEDEKKEYKIDLATISSVQKGKIVEARVAELITLYGDNLSCYRPEFQTMRELT